MIEELFHTLLPPLCPVCGEEIEDCICSELGHLIEEPHCSLCSLPFQSKLKGEWLCGECAKEGRYFEKAIALFVYDDDVKNFIHRLKYIGLPAGLKSVCKKLSEKIKACGLNADFIVPVPLSEDRLLKRGFNQASLIANALSGYLRVPVKYNLLIRKKNTLPLFQLSKSDRKRILKGAFEVKGRLNGECIFLVDDVMTTGTTINECSRVLKRAGAGKVYAIVLARSIL